MYFRADTYFRKYEITLLTLTKEVTSTMLLWLVILPCFVLFLNLTVSVPKLKSYKIKGKWLPLSHYYITEISLAVIMVQFFKKSLRCWNYIMIWHNRRWVLINWYNFTNQTTHCGILCRVSLFIKSKPLFLLLILSGASLFTGNALNGNCLFRWSDLKWPLVLQVQIDAGRKKKNRTKHSLPHQCLH